MTKTTFLTMLYASMALTTACSIEDPYSDYLNGGGFSWNEGSGGSGGSNGTYTVSLADISIDKTTAEPTTSATAYYPEEEDNIDNESFGSATTVNIVFNDGSVSCDAPSTMTVNTDGAHLTIDHGSSSKVVYNVSGTTSAGSLTIVGEKKYKLCLNDVSITNPDSTAINLLSKKRAYIVLAGSNTLTDGSSSKDSDQKAAFYCKGKMLFSGSGVLNVYGNTKNAIACADYIIFSTGNNIYAKSTANHGIKANDGIFINGGILNVEVSAAAAKGISCESDIIVNGGRTTCITTGAGAWDTDDNETKGSAGMKADGNITVNGGQLYMKSTGTGGHVYAYGSDDAINSKSHMTISGGYVMAHSTGNDGLDANGNCYIKGGVVYAIGTTTPEVGIDANTEGGYKLYVQGGTIVAIGGLEGGAQLSQSCYATSSWSKSTWYALYNGDELALAFKTPSSGGSTLVVSTAGTASLKSGVTVTDGTTYFNGMGNIGGTINDGSSVSLSSYTASGGMPGGGGPGGRW